MAHEESSGSVVTVQHLNRRQFLKRAGILTAGLAALPVLAACGGTAATTAPTAGASGAAPTTAATTAATGGVSGAASPTTAVSGAASPAATATKAATAGTAAAGSPTAATVAASPAGSPAVLKGAKLSLLQWSSFIPAADEKMKALAADWGKQNGAEVTIEIVSGNDLQPRTAAAVQNNSGPDIIQMQYNWPWLYESACADVSAEANALGAKYGGYYDAMAKQSTVNGVWRAIPYGIVPNAITYRTDWLKAAGYNAFPTTLDDFLTVGTKLKQAGHNYGAPAGHSFGDPKTFWMAVLWAWGGKEVDQTGKTVTINSPETLKALEWSSQFWKDASDPDGLSWDDNSNNRFYAAEQIWATQNGASIYINALKQAPDLAKNSDNAAFPKGPGGQGVVTLSLSHAVMSYSKNVGAAKEFVRWLMEKPQYDAWMEAGNGYTAGPLKAYENHPVWNKDPKMKPFLDTAKESRWVGWPGPPSRATSDADQKYIIVDMFARVFQGTSPKDSMSQAEQALQAIYK